MKLCNLLCGILYVMKKANYLFVSAIVIGVLVGMFFWESDEAVEPVAETYRHINGTVADASFRLAIADTPEKRVQGLSGVEVLQEDEGMLFVFPNRDTHGIWMKDMYIDLDILWLNGDGVVVHIERNVATSTYPKVFTPSTPAWFVVEVPSGATTKHGIEVGNEFKFASEKN